MFAVMRIPKRFTKKSRIKISPEAFYIKEKAYAYIEECNRRHFLINDYLIVVRIQFIDIRDELCCKTIFRR